MGIDAFQGAKTTSKLLALEALKANIMVADAGLNITYMNPAVIDLLKEAEPDLKKELPRFSVSTLIGSNIDVFHKNPAHQRGMLAALKQRHAATIRVGTRVFDLLVTPLKKGSKVYGFVVEWADAKERLLNLDYAAQMAAISRSQAIIEFSVDGEVLSANDNFQQILGYRLSEISGKHHSIFVSKDYATSQEYRDFWQSLRSGKFQAAEFKRVTKDGRTVIIAASYNPILDMDGKVVKVVKFATDVTARVQTVSALGDSLKRLCSGDFAFQLTEPFAADFEFLRHDLNRSVSQLGDTFKLIAASTRVMSDGSREISQGVNDLSRRTETQAASLEETAAALDEVTANVNSSAQRAQDARTVAAKAKANAEASANVVAQAVEAMSRIEDSSSKISNIIGVIDEIAFQTNLLALNAGVEAARAGEAGRGFAVVAQEVRELAQRSAKAAKEIKDLIQNSTTEVASGVKLVSDTGTALTDISDLILQVNDHIVAISTAAREQATGLGEVNSAVNSMDQTTQQNAAMVEQSSAAASTLASESNKLVEMIGQFKLSGTATAASGFGSQAHTPAHGRAA
ncbi:methyl-accepting chemotaxis protein [Allorhizobium taibaishanense]|uniref:Chemotaxis protein n=1 Tax=Allorhizobium taibaishanense TaxID=887144 RepID=A0A1Q9A4C0_9HYPH|nr:methyl-accepting chemotaxis protein [Allorhizobium taibaishanense]MBB4006485.1 methyl-accepting chemotaxis protein [Allorhizobium taibaishanense]OLP49423.1 chemotaxis protein [Allorhizobium taibaishanense]